MRLSRIFIIFLVSSILVSGCGDDDNLNGVAYPRIRLLLAPGAKHAEITRVVLSVSGPEMELMEFELDIDDDGKTASGTISVPSGRDRVFAVTAYLADGTEATGEQHVDVLEPGAEFLLEMQLKPAGNLPSEPGSVNSSLYFVDASLTPAGRIYKLENGQVSTHYDRPSNGIYYLAVAPDGTIYFSDANDFNLYKLQDNSEVLVYGHNTYLGDIEFDSQGKLYFSESTGADGDGFIYMLDDSQATLFYRVRLSQVDGFWAGTFAFDGDNNLWLSSGNHGGASFYRVVDGVPQRVFTSQEAAIMGFFFEPDGSIVYANWRSKIYLLTVPGYLQSEVYVYPDPDSWLSDVAPVISPQGDADDGTIPDVDTITGDDGALMVLIPAGEFQMGDAFNEGEENEVPVHTVYVDAFYMDVYEVTNAQYQKFMDETGHEAPRYWDDPGFNAPDQPVVGVNWNGAVTYAEWAGERLPKEAEWEKAARGGLVGKRYPWGDDDPDGTQCNFADKNTNFGWSDRNADDGYQYTAPVGSFAANGYGLYDMTGNVWEWCSDWYDGDYYSVSPKRNPTGPDSGTRRVLLGGSWNNDPINLRVSHRGNDVPTDADNRYGFRCVSQD